MARYFLRAGAATFVELSAVSFNSTYTRTQKIYPSNSNWMLEAAGNGAHVVLGGAFPFTFEDGEIYITLPPQSMVNARTVRPYESLSSGNGCAKGYNAGYISPNMQIFRDTTYLARVSASSATYCMRFRLVGTSIKLRYWAPGSGEPSTWNLEVTDDAYTSGGVGFGIYNANYTMPPVGLDLGGTNAPTTGNLMTVFGQVTRGGTPVAGAKVVAVLHSIDTTLALIPGIHVAQATTDSNGNYTLYFDTDDPGPWLISARAIINGVYYASDARLVYLG